MNSQNFPNSPKMRELSILGLDPYFALHDDFMQDPANLVSFETRQSGLLSPKHRNNSNALYLSENFAPKELQE